MEEERIRVNKVQHTDILADKIAGTTPLDARSDALLCVR